MTIEEGVEDTFIYAGKEVYQDHVHTELEERNNTLSFGETIVKIMRWEEYWAFVGNKENFKGISIDIKDIFDINHHMLVSELSEYRNQIKETYDKINEHRLIHLDYPGQSIQIFTKE